LLLDQNYLKFVAIIVSYLLCILDRCGKYFGTILNFLRDGSVPLPETKRELEELLQEAKYFCVEVNFILWISSPIQWIFVYRMSINRMLFEQQSFKSLLFEFFAIRLTDIRCSSLIIAYSINERPSIESNMQFQKLLKMNKIDVLF
jgi:hypothetical protein